MSDDTFKVGDRVESLKTGRQGVLQASYPNGQFLMFHGKGYEHLYPEEMKHVEDEKAQKGK